MSSIYESTAQGLTEAIEHEKGNLPDVSVDKISISPFPKYTNNETKAIAIKKCTSQP